MNVMPESSRWSTLLYCGLLSFAGACGGASPRAEGASGQGGRRSDAGATAGTSAGSGTSTAGRSGASGASGRDDVLHAAGLGGGSNDAGAGSAAGSGALVPGACDPGSTSTSWASDCQSAVKQACVDGTWQDPGSTTNDPLQCESAHFAVHAPGGVITAEQCTQATQTLETVVWPTLFGSPIYFPEPYCQSTEKFKASIVIHSDYGLTGGGWGSGYMGMWVGPGATADHWGLAHEFTHAVQSQTKGLACGGPPTNNYCGWLFESHANWTAHQLPEYHQSNVHCSEMLVNAPHLYLGSTRDRYCNWQFMEFLKDKFCYSAVNELWTSSTPSNDPFSNLAATRHWTASQFNDFFGEWAMHNVTWDYRDPPPSSNAGADQGALYRSAKGYGAITDTSKPERRLRTVRLEALEPNTGRYVVPALQAPQRLGYNVVHLHARPGASQVTVAFRGVTQADAHSDWRWGLVATDAAVSTPRYSALQRGAQGELSFCLQPDEELWLVVVATPSELQQVVWDQPYPTVYRYPYAVELTGADPEGYQPNAASPSAQGTRWQNGGGWVADGAKVADGAFVGPYATVLGGTIGATARIEDHAVIIGGTVSSGTVGGLTVMTGSLSVADAAQVVSAWPYSPGFFERPQRVSGTAKLLGDVEYRGANADKSSGSYCGYVDATTDSNCAMKDVTVPGPYLWRQ